MNDEIKKISGESHSFQQIAKKLNPILKDSGIPLNFRGYSDTIKDYFQMDDGNLVKVFSMMTDCNLWNNYISDITALIKMESMNISVSLDRIKAFECKEEPNMNISENISQCERVIKDFKILIKQLESKSYFFENAYWHCYKIYSKSFSIINKQN